MVSCLLVTKPSPPSGRGLRKNPTKADGNAVIMMMHTLLGNIVVNVRIVITKVFCWNIVSTGELPSNSSPTIRRRVHI